MKLSTEDLQDLLGYLDLAEDFRPLVKKAIGVLKSYGPEFRELFDMMAGGFADSNITVFKKYVDSGLFTREEALLLTIDTKAALHEVLKKSSASYSNSSKND